MSNLSKSKKSLLSFKKLIEKAVAKNDTKIARVNVGIAFIGNFLFLKEKLDISHFF
jgi:hypothetical protein